MHRDQVGAGGGKVLDEAVGLFNHQMHVQKGVGVLAHRLQHRQAKGDIGDKIAVHHVKVDQIGAGDAVQAGAQPGEVGGENGGGNFNHGEAFLSVFLNLLDQNCP